MHHVEKKIYMNSKDQQSYHGHSRGLQMDFERGPLKIILEKDLQDQIAWQLNLKKKKDQRHILQAVGGFIKNEDQ